MPVHKYTLANNVRVLVEPLPHVQSAAVGLWCVTGSSHEEADEAGITHLIEHMLFKGTSKRTAKEIAEAIEGRGGMLNAFTDKESTCYYCRVLMEDVAHGVEVLGDMMTRSLFDPEELKREKGVVLEEIKRSEDEPGDLVHDLHFEHCWPSHPLGKPVIGTPESVSSFEREHLLRYMERRYRGENVVLSIAGHVDPEVALAAAEETLGSIPSGGATAELDRPVRACGTREVSRDVEQVHFCIGAEGCSVYDDDLYTMTVLDGALGGSMSSRLFQEIREKRGLAYAIGSYSIFYRPGGAYTVYGGTSLENWPLVQELVSAEIEKVIQAGLTEDELTRTKNNLRGNLVMSLEGTSSRMMRMARSEIVHGRDVPIEETLAKLGAVTNEGLIELARRVFANGLSTTAIGPFEA
ncbi:MAG: insulinase family protein [Fimbriimonadaceae bacterium]|nr:insulinase family protein [Fimbriimonadaceae bacterium]